MQEHPKDEVATLVVAHEFIDDVCDVCKQIITVGLIYVLYVYIILYLHLLIATISNMGMPPCLISPIYMCRIFHVANIAHSSASDGVQVALPDYEHDFLKCEDVRCFTYRNDVMWPLPWGIIRSDL